MKVTEQHTAQGVYFRAVTPEGDYTFRTETGDKSELLRAAIDAEFRARQLLKRAELLRAIVDTPTN